MSQITTIIFDIGNVLVEQRFEALAKSLSSDEEAVFLDDVKANVRAAQALGIHGIVFQNKEQAERELAVLGVV